MAKKLKKISDYLVTYVQNTGAEAQNSAEKERIISYAQSKIKIIDWYMALIDNDSEKYIVPHSKNYLNEIKEQLLTAIQEIKDRRIPEIKKIGSIIIEYPEGYEG
jgi:hypothetical protein